MSTPKNEKNPVVEVAKEQLKEDADIVTLSTGVRARIKPVSASLIATVTSRFEYPKVPVWFNEDKGREEENPVHPDYVHACERVDTLRSQAAMDTMAMFGLELVDGVPEDDTWIKKLHLIGIEFDDTDPIVREFNYKKHVALATRDFVLLSQASGLSQEAAALAAESFQRS